MKVIIPHARPETTFDIKYFTRERRRAHEPALNTAPRKHLAVNPRTDGVEGAPLPGSRARVQGAAGVTFVKLLDDTNNGYT